MLPRLNVKVDFDLPIIHEIIDFMNDKKNITPNFQRKPTGKALGHDINWRTVGNPWSDFSYLNLTFEFESESDKILFILKWL